MFGADVGHLSMLDAGPGNNDARHADKLDYLIPKYHHQHPWQHDSTHQKSVGEDFILIAEFSEQEGPRPVIVIPKDGGKHFDQNEFSVKILAVDHQSSIVEGCHVTEDAQVVMSDSDQGAHAFIHHIVLNDIQARGYVRPFCISYVTSDPMKVMKCYEKLSSQLKEVARLMKFGNKLVFMRDLEMRLEDLDYTKTQLLISQSSSRATSTSQGDSELLQMLNTIRQCMEEVKDIMASLKTQLMDKELEDRFQVYERRLRSRQHNTSEGSDTGSLKDFSSSEPSTDTELSGSFTYSPEFSLFIKSKDIKPKLLDVSIIGGKRRFDRSLRGLHELCSWGAKEGLQKLRVVRDNLKRDMSSIVLEDFDLNIMSPDAGVLSFGNNCVGANFLSACDSSRDLCCLRRKACGSSSHFNHISSFGSFDSFKSLPSSYQSFLDDETMYSVNSSEEKISSMPSLLERSNSEDYGLTFHVEDVNCTETKQELEHTIKNRGSTSATFTSDSEHSFDEINAMKERSCSDSSEYDTIDIDKDLKCVAKGCPCTDSTIKAVEIKKNADIKKNGKVRRHAAKTAKADGVPVVTDKAGQVQAKESVISGACMCSDDDDDSALGLENNSRIIMVEGVKICVECKKQKIELLDGIGASNSINTSLYDIKTTLTDSTATLTDVSGEDFDIKLDTFEDIPFKESRDLTDSFEEDRDTPQPNLTSDLDCTNTSVIKTESDIDEEGGINRKMTSDLLNRATGVLGDIHVGIEALSKDTRSLSESSDDLCDKQVHVGMKALNKDTRRLSDSSVGQYYGLNAEDLDGGKDFPHRHSISGSSGSMLDSTEVRLLYGRDGTTPGLVRPLDNVTGHGSRDAGILKQLTQAGKRLKWTSHGFSIQPDQSTVHCVHKVLTAYNNLQHIVYSLLSRKPVVIIATEKLETNLKELVKALSVFTPVTEGGLAISLVCQVKQLKVAEARKFQIRGMIRSERRAIDFLVPSSVRRYVTLVDLDKMLVSCQPYQGTLLNFISAIYNKRFTFKSEQALFTFVQMQLLEMSTKALTFYHSITATDKEWDFSGTTLPRKSSMLELSAEKYLSRGGHLYSDCRIIKHLSELVKIQQIDEEFRSKFLTDAPVCPFAVAYKSIQTYRL